MAAVEQKQAHHYPWESIRVSDPRVRKDVSVPTQDQAELLDWPCRDMRVNVH